MPISDLCWNEATTEATILSLGTAVAMGRTEATILSGFGATLLDFGGKATTSAGFVFIYLHWLLGLRLASKVLCTKAFSKDILLTGLAFTRLTTLQRRLAHIVNHMANPNLSSHKFFGGFFKEFVSK
jgi:hypothetical protein